MQGICDGHVLLVREQRVIVIQIIKHNINYTWALENWIEPLQYYTCEKGESDRDGYKVNNLPNQKNKKQKLWKRGRRKKNDVSHFTNFEVSFWRSGKCCAFGFVIWKLTRKRTSISWLAYNSEIIPHLLVLNYSIAL